MEAHHPHHVTHKKKWPEYLLEFFMLFLAVFMGFLAENIRETNVESVLALTNIRSIFCKKFNFPVDIYEIFRIYSVIVHTKSFVDNMSKQNKPTSAELEILDLLWERGRATVREIHEIINQRRKPTLYTTVLKTLQIMHEKGLVERDSASKAHIYRAKQTQDETQKSLVSDLLEKAFRGSALKLVQHVLETKPASAEELVEIRKLIAEAEDKNK